MPEDDMLRGLVPCKEDTESREVMDTIAENMLERGFTELWSRPAHGYLVLFGDTEKRLYLLKLATTGRKAFAAAHAGTTNRTVCDHKKKDPTFAASCQEAMEYFRDILVGEMYRRGVVGYDEEVLGGKNKDQIFKLKRYSDKMLTTLGQIHIKQLQRDSTAAVVVAPPKIVNNQFDTENMSVEDLAMFKKLLQNQQARVEEAEANALAIDGKVVPDGQ